MIDFLRYAGIVLGVGLIPGVWLGTVFADGIRALWRKAFPRDTGRHVSGGAAEEPRMTTGPAATVLLANRNAEAPGFPMRVSLTPQEHADAMRELAGPYLPPSPAGEHPYPPYVPAWLPAVRKRTEDHAPWTGSQPALDDETEAEWMRREYVRSHLRDAAEVTPELMREVLAGLRALPAGGVSFDCGNGLHAPVCDGRGCSCSCHGKAAAYGEKPAADVLEGERLAAVMRP